MKNNGTMIITALPRPFLSLHVTGNKHSINGGLSNNNSHFIMVHKIIYDMSGNDVMIMIQEIVIYHNVCADQKIHLNLWHLQEQILLFPYHAVYQ